MFRPSELHQFLESLGVKAKKSLSQNFLIDGNIIRKILKAAELQPGDLVVEIGAGPGALTQELLQAGARVIAIEKDRTFAQALRRLQTSDNRLEIFEEDILEFPLEEQLKKRLKKGEKAKVIANLPYHITTPILTSLIPLRDVIHSLTVMVQKEVGLRFTAQKGTADYSSYTIFLQYYSTPEYCFTISASCFYPPPKVESAVVRLTLHAPPAISSPERFFEMTRKAFHQRRKMLRASLKELYEPAKVEAALQAVGKDPLARPETLSLEEFIAFFEKL